MYTWLETDTELSTAHVDLLRQIRVSKSEPETIVVSREGRTGKMGLTTVTAGEGEDWAGGAMAVEVTG